MSERLFDNRQDPYFRIENVALDREDLDIYEKMVYIVLCRYANNNDGAFPSYETLSKKASVSRRKAIDVVKSLIDKGLIEKHIRIINGTKENTSNVYFVMSAEKEECSAQHAPHQCTPCTTVVHSVHPKKNYIKKNSLNKDLSLSKNPQEEKTGEGENPLELKKEIKTKIGININLDKLKYLVEVKGIERVNEVVNNWQEGYKMQVNSSPLGFFVKAIENDIPAESANNSMKYTHANCNKIKMSHENFEQREHEEGEFERYYANVKR